MAIKTSLSTVRLQKVLIITLCWTLFQIVAYLNGYFLIDDLVQHGKLTGAYPFWPDFIGNMVLGIFGGLLGGWLLVYRVNSGYRQRSFRSGIINSGLIFILLYLLVAFVLLFLMGFIYFAVQEGITPAFHKALNNLLFNFDTPSLFVTMGVWALLVLGTQFMLQVNDKFGQGVLWKFLTGKYYHPRDEERIFMFLDLRGSTTIAEQIGNKPFFDLLKELYHDITAPVIRSLGEIYQYIGDEVVISWPVARGLRDDNCIQCFFRIQDALAKRKAQYQQKYNITPSVKAGLHLGTATVGEIGVLKKDIVYSGDVLNTTSRIQGECNKYEVDLLVSGELLGRLKNTSDYATRPIGEIQLRGKTEKIELIAVSQA